MTDLNIERGSAVSSITWRQPFVDYDNETESTITLSLENAGNGSWLAITADRFAFDSADGLLNLAVVAEELRAAHEKAGVFG